MIETYSHAGEGYNPFIIRDGWQVAQLNYIPGHGFDDIDRIEIHRDTDEVFILLRGHAVLVVARPEEEGVTFYAEKMKSGITYNIPAGTWHNIAMDADVEIIIVEKSGTHNQDCAFQELSQSGKDDLYALIRKELL